MWDLRRQQQCLFDPLLYLGDDIMHDVFLYAVSLWDIAESRTWETEIIPRSHADGPLALTSVSQQWNRFVTSSPPLWSYLVIDTGDEDVLESLRLFLLLSRNRRLFIVLRGKVVVCEAIVTELQRVGDRIDALIYPPSISHPTLGKVGVYPELAHDQLESIRPWYRLSVMQPRGHVNDYSFPSSLQGLWIDGPFPMSHLGILSHFRSLSSLSLTFYLDSGLSPDARFYLEFPSLERLRIQSAFASDPQPNVRTCMTLPKLTHLYLLYNLDLDLENPPEDPESGMQFDSYPVLQEVQIHMEIHLVSTVAPTHPVAKQLQPERQRVLWQRTHAQKLEQAEEVHLRSAKRLLERAEERRPDLLLLRFAVFLQTTWHNLLPWLENLRQTSLELTIAMPEEESGFIENTTKQTLSSGLPRSMELTSSKVLYFFPNHIQKLCLRGCGIPNSLTTTHLPSLISLEIKAEGLNYLLVMGFIQAPQLQDLRVLVQDGPWELQEYDWRDTTSNLLDTIFLRIDISCHAPDHCVVFRLPQTRSLDISSPYLPFHLFLAEPPPLLYSLRASIDNPSAVWQDNLMTQWINPHYGVPHLARFSTLTSLRRIVLDQSLYLLSKPSPTDELFKLLAKDIHICPQLTSVTVAQCPSSWPSFLCQLRARNRTAMLSKTAKCIEELSFYQPLHATITSWLLDAIQAKNFNMVEVLPIRQGNAWPVRPFEGEGVFRSCYVCYITGMELSCLESATQGEDCGLDRAGTGSMIDAMARQVVRRNAALAI